MVPSYKLVWINNWFNQLCLGCLSLLFGQRTQLFHILFYCYFNTRSWQNYSFVFAYVEISVVAVSVNDFNEANSITPTKTWIIIVYFIIWNIVNNQWIKLFRPKQILSLKTPPSRQNKRWELKQFIWWIITIIIR